MPMDQTGLMTYFNYGKTEVGLSITSNNHLAVAWRGSSEFSAQKGCHLYLDVSTVGDGHDK